MSPDATRRLKVLLRTRAGNDRRDLLAELLQGISDHSTAGSWAILLPETADPIRELMIAAYQEGAVHRRITPVRVETGDELAALAQHFLGNLPPDESMYVHLTESDRIGVLECSVDVLRHAVIPLLDFDGDGVLSTRTDMSSGFRMDRTVDNSTELLEFETW